MCLSFYCHFLVWLPWDSQEVWRPQWRQKKALLKERLPKEKRQMVLPLDEGRVREGFSDQIYESAAEEVCYVELLSLLESLEGVHCVGVPLL